jgi:hypothetical protein
MKQGRLNLLGNSARLCGTGLGRRNQTACPKIVKLQCFIFGKNEGVTDITLVSFAISP